MVPDYNGHHRMERSVLQIYVRIVMLSVASVHFFSKKDVLAQDMVDPRVFHGKYQVLDLIYIK